MNKVISGWVLTLALSATGLTGLASTIDKNPNVRVVGLGLHQETSRDIYMGALYIGKLQTTPADPVSAEGPRVMEYRILARRTSVRSLLGNMMLQGELATGSSASAEVQQLAGDIMAAVQGSLYAGDSLEVELSEQGNTRVWLNGQQLASSEGRASADFFMAGWTGERGPSTRFRNDLLSGEINADLLAIYNETTLSEERLATVAGWFESEAVEEAPAEAAPLEAPTLVAASVAVVSDTPAEVIEPEVTETAASEVSEALAQEVAVEEVTETPELPQPADDAPLVAEQAPTEEPVQMALASPAPVLSPEIPEGVAALDAQVYSQRLAVFNNMLLRKVYSNINYPRSAVRRNLQGKLELDMTLNGEGEIQGVDVARSSGHSVLDEAAVKAVNKALKDPLTEIDPVAVAEYADGEDRLVIPVPVAFILTE